MCGCLPDYNANAVRQANDVKAKEKVSETIPLQWMDDLAEAV